MMLVTDLAVLDHADGTVLLIANALVHGGRARPSDGRLRRRRRAAGRDGAPTSSTPSRRRSPCWGSRRVPEVTQQHGAGGLRGRRGAGAGAHPRRRRLPGGPGPALRDRDRRPTRSTSTACCARPTPRRTCTCCASRAGRAFDVVGSSPEALVTVTGSSAVVHPPAGTRPRGADAGGGRAAGRGAAGRPQGARRARHARRPGPQRPGPGVRARLGRGARLHARRALQPRHAPGLDRRRRGRPRARRVRRLRRHVPRRHGLRGAEAAGDGDHRVARADAGGRSTPAPSGTSTPAATWTWPSPSAPPCCTTAGPTCRPAPASSPTATPATEEAETRHKARAVLSAIAAAEGLRERLR